MKKQKTLAVLLSAAMVAGAIPTAALAEVVGSNSDSGVKAAELSEDQEIEEQNEDSEDETGSGYVLMNVPYDEVYGTDIKNETKVDAVSSATKKKTKKQNGPAKEKRYSLIAVLFAISGLICWCGISQVISNSVSSAMKNAFHIPPLYTTIFLVVVAAIVVLRKNATVHVLDVVVPIMAGCYLLITLFVILKNIGALPSVFQRIFEEAFGLRQVAAGGFGAVLMNGIKRGLFSNEAGSGSAPCAAAAADVSHPAKAGLMQAFGVFIDTILICTCSALLMLLAPADKIAGLQGMDLLQSAMQYHLGEFGVIFIAVILFLFSFSTFIGILFYARSNVAYLFGDNWLSQTAYKILALVMLFIGGLAAYTFVWDLGDVGIGLMTIFNMIALIPLSGQAIDSLKDYERKEK